MLRQTDQPTTGTVLVADDQAANRELLEELLTAQGCKVIAVPDGAAAVEQLTRTQVDLVLLDVMMPYLNGFEGCEKIKNNPDTYLIPGIIITALSDKQDRTEGIKAGAAEFLRFVRPIIRHHHQKLDGPGYPDGLRGDAIPVTARVLQIVDVYDALTTDRPYKKAFSVTDALQTMKEEVAKGWWDPHIFDQFERLVRIGAADFLSRSAAAGR